MGTCVFHVVLTMTASRSRARSSVSYTHLYLSAIVASEMKPESSSSTSSVAAASVDTAPQEVMDDLANSLPTDSTAAQSTLPEDPVE